MPVRDIYLKIEQIADYSPVDPDPHAPSPIQYRRDCMRTPGHEDGTIPLSEVNARMLTALVYREYLNPSYLIPKVDKLVLADVNEPAFHRRVPGTVIYAQPGDRLRIHVFNGDTMPHSFHLHGLEYGIDSDGSWPFGSQSADGRRSDEICPGESWTYTFDITGEMMGAWPFHDHHRHITASVDRGLFGGLIVLPSGEDLPPRSKLPSGLEKLVEELRHGPSRGRPPVPEPAGGAGGPGHGRGHGWGGGRGSRGPLPHPDLEVLGQILEEWVHSPQIHPRPQPSAVLHVPLFFHVLRGSGTPAFDSGDLNNGEIFESTFGAEGQFRYHCQHHPNMRGTVRVVAGSPNLPTVRILDPPGSPEMKFDPGTVSVQPGGTVRWEHAGSLTHTVTEDGLGLPSFCFNGRSFVGNTPTILAEAGQKIRWYVFNLDLGMMWHNFHPHAQRWKFANETIDVRSLGPAESFIVEMAAPPVLLHSPGKGKEEREKEKKGKEDKGKPREYRLRGDFLFHCHVEMHMMSGMAGLVRSHQTVRLTQAEADQIAAETGLPLDPGDNACPAADLERCHIHDCGKWEEVQGTPQVSMMHAALLPNTTKVLFWGYGPRADQSRLWDYSTATGTYSLPANQPVDVAADEDIWSCEHAFLNTPEGTLLVHGGYALGGPMPPLSANTERLSFLFDPSTLQWKPTKLPSTALTTEARFYATTLTLGDRRVLTLYGSNLLTGAVSRSIEIYNPSTGSWDAPKPLPTADTDGVSWAYLYYPWTYLLPSGDLFIAGPQTHTRRFNPAATPIPGDPARRWATNAGTRGGNHNGTSVFLPLRPPNYEPRVLIAGGNTASAEQSTEIIDLSTPSPAWQSLPEWNLHYSRDRLNAVLLPDGRVFVAGGMEDTTNPLKRGGPAEIFDPDDPDAGWLVCDSMKHPRGYHSAAILLSDGSVLTGGDRVPGGDRSGETTLNERYFPWYFFKPRPRINSAPASITYSATFMVETPDASAIGEVVLLRPGAVTHGFDMSQRFIECAIQSRAADSIQIQAPPDDTIAPPGHYLLFMVNAGRVPSVANWIRLGP